MKIEQVLEGDEITPEIKWKQNGDGSYTARIDYGNGKVFVHSNKNRSALEKLVKERYGPKKFI